MQHDFADHVRKILRRYSYTIAIILFLAGITLRLLPTVFNAKGSLWEVLGDIGTFLALIVSMYLLYELSIKREERELFLRDLEDVLGRQKESDWQGLVNQLRGSEYRFGLIEPGSPVHRVEFDAGLTDAEVALVESWFSFRFPPDLRAFLQTALPRGPQFPDWRSGDKAILRDWLDRPRQGVLSDIEHNGFWQDE